MKERKNSRQLANGRWQILFRDSNHIRHRDSFDTWKEAKAELDKKRTSVRESKYVAPADIPTVEQAARAFLDAKKVSTSSRGAAVSSTTIEFWQNHIDKYIVPTLGRYKLNAVDALLIESKREEWKQLGLTAPSINKVLTTLSAIFKKATKTTPAVQANPVQFVDRMAREVEFTDDDQTDVDLREVSPHEVYSPDQLKRLIAAADPGMFHVMLMRYASTGMRHGEGLGLKWSNVDFHKCEITIQRGYRGKKHGFSTTKTTSSTRRIRVSDALMLALKKWKLQCPPSPLDLVYPKDDGQPLYRKATWRAMRRAITKANEGKPASEQLRNLTIHSLRHSFASILLMGGTVDVEVSALLGHKDVTTTRKVYSHFIPKMGTDAAAALGGLLFGADSNVVHQVSTS
jgi:integrase